MKLIFVRHGHPNYKNDCLTELGHLHAEAAAERLKNEKIDKIFSSSCGRAYETAEHIAARHGLDIVKLDFMRELKWGVKNTEDFLHPWDRSKEWVAKGKDVMDLQWDTDEEYTGRTVTGCYYTVAEGIDQWLKAQGLEREGGYYRITERNDDVILLASHAGSSSAVLAHIFNMPFPFVCSAIPPDYTAITVVNFKGEAGELTAPEFELVNDARHIEGISVENYFGN